MRDATPRKAETYQFNANNKLVNAEKISLINPQLTGSKMEFPSYIESVIEVNDEKDSD